MRLFRLPIAVLLAFGLMALPAQAQSQQNQSQHGTTVGLGLSLTQGFANSGTNSISGSPLSISVPVTFSSFRIEPEIGYVRSSQSSDLTDATQSSLLVGAGAFYLSQMEDVQFQIGARFGLRRTAMDYETEAVPAEWENSPDASSLPSDINTTTLNYTLGPALGGEYYVSDHLSIGVEARMLYTTQEQNDLSPPTVISLPPSGSSESSGSLINTEGAAYLRIHF